MTKLGQVLYLILILILLTFSSIMAQAKSTCEKTKYFKICKTVLVSNKSIDPSHLTDKIVLYAYKHGISPELYAAILRNESNFKLSAYNKKTQDYGIAQINSKTALSLKLNKKMLISDLDYSLDHGAAILAYFKKRYSKKEPYTWFCRYNVGTAKLKDNILKNCSKYKEKIDLHLAFIEAK